ncbi:MAG: YbaB/EbfC family nucleoid-associated protein [Anaerovibrio sp.]|uniref:YbaB/EbfC family nucleoid-associated protein n=1 Tax=Anaerovibrio sp. TaxID=1872532 RepID=UPI0025E55719|nr:YbaB/EbfC family nucleoid-associated protein [Anaerovibrio sp.]MCR5177062.1 YbaB/EbfC family nucleoid-associated protein [Anaerovibrio sp.]
MFGGMGGMNNMNGMMKKMQKLQKQMQDMQEQLKQKTVDVTAGGGAVTITMNGEKEVKGIVIDPAAVDPDDVEMLQDLLAAAFNEASKKVDDMMASEMGKLTGGLGLPPGMF